MARRILFVIFLGLTLIVCVALAVSESLTNRTGKTATAVTVTFSGQVRITSYDEDVFPTKEPSNRSETFRFSGGQLENGARLSVSWTPSTAEITSTEWETTGAASSASTGNSVPLTYEEIMAQIAHYPGSDEPLYVPAENEQIWLTDLEGHADIYDNDSIKVNYAPGFDKSQITRIDVYRNGVKMRFLPALRDVLTNEQMKTFDGSPMERTPKSGHTDHEIIGYEYSFRMLAKDESLLGTASAKVETPFRYNGKAFMYIGHNFQERMGVTDDALSKSLGDVKAMGFGGVQLGTYYYMDSATSTELFPQYTQDSAIGWCVTPQEADLRRMLRLIQSVGLECELRVELWVAQAYVSQGGADRWGLKPRDVDAWFANYTTICTANAVIAQEEGVDVLCVGVELDSMQQYARQWRDLVQAVRAVFSGKVVFAVGATGYLASYAETHDRGTLSHNLAASWDVFDYVEMTCWSPVIETQRDQRLSTLVAGFASYWQPAFANYSTVYPDKPVAFGEIGLWQHDGAGMGYDPNATVPDAQEFADLWVAYLAGAESLGASTIAVWDYALVGGTNGLGLVTLNGTTALRSMVSVLGGTEPPSAEDSLEIPEVPQALESAPYAVSYLRGVRPDILWLAAGQAPVGQGKHWGLPGSDVKGVKLALLGGQLYIRWETYDADIAGAYSYEVHLRQYGVDFPLAMVSVNPSAAESHLTLSDGQSWIDDDACIRVVELEDDSVTVVLSCSSLPLGFTVQELGTTWGSYYFGVVYGMGDSREAYGLPDTNVLH